MSISHRIKEAFLKYWIYEQNNILTNELDNALIQVMIAVDGTATKEYPKIPPKEKNQMKFEWFINNNLDIISRVTFFSFKMASDFKINEKTFATLMYEIRCNILHNWFVKDIIWNDRSLKYEDGKYYIPRFLLMWLLSAVIWSETNKDEIINHGVWSTIPVIELWYKNKDIRIPFDQYIWKKSEILKLIQFLE